MIQIRDQREKTIRMKTNMVGERRQPSLVYRNVVEIYFNHNQIRRILKDAHRSDSFIGSKHTRLCFYKQILALGKIRRILIEILYVKYLYLRKFA